MGLERSRLLLCRETRLFSSFANRYKLVLCLLFYKALPRSCKYGNGL